MSDLLSEQRISLAGLARELEVSPPTIWRWWKKGIRGIRLETYMQGGRRQTTREAHARFVDRTTAAANCVPPPSPTNRKREAAIARAERELAQAGI